MSRVINPEWEFLMVRAINSQIAFRITDVPLIFENQGAPDYATLEKWIDISFFGPLYTFQTREAVATLQVQFRAFQKEIGANIYSMNDLSGLIANAATEPIRVPEWDQCFKVLDVKILPKGRIFSPHAAVASGVVVTYEIQPKE